MIDKIFGVSYMIYVISHCAVIAKFPDEYQKNKLGGYRLGEMIEEQMYKNYDIFFR